MNELGTNIIKEAIQELNEQLADNTKITFSDDVRFIGPNACVDSMSFVTLIAIIEELIADKTGKEIQLVTDKAFSQEHSPFHSIVTLSNYVDQLTDEAI